MANPSKPNPFFDQTASAFRPPPALSHRATGPNPMTVSESTTALTRRRVVGSRTPSSADPSDMTLPTSGVVRTTTLHIGDENYGYRP